jgi:hypothetical protein
VRATAKNQNIPHLLANGLHGNATVSEIKPHSTEYSMTLCCALLLDASYHEAGLFWKLTECVTHTRTLPA